VIFAGSLMGAGFFIVKGIEVSEGHADKFKKQSVVLRKMNENFAHILSIAHCS
jgi:hypothetical protein